MADEYWANHIARNDSIIVDVCQALHASSKVDDTSADKVSSALVIMREREKVAKAYSHPPNHEIKP